MIVINPSHKCPSPQAAIEPPIWCAYIAELCDADSILDAEADGLTLEETADIVGNQDCIIVSMGANPSASSTPKAGVALKLAELIPNASVAGLHFHNMPSVESLVGVTPAWRLLDLSKYRAHNWHCLDGRDRSGYGVIYSSFGCPFNCHYCNIKTLYSGITYRRPLDVLNEIDYLVARGVKNLKFCDELFTVNKDHVNEICDRLSYRNYDLNIWGYAKTGTVNSEMLKNMKRAGFNWLCYGFESGAEDVLNGVGKKQTMEQMFQAVEMTHEAGINIIGNFIFGLPDDDMGTTYATKRLSKQLGCEWVNYYCAMAYPGSKLYENTPKEDLPDRWEDYDQYSPNAKPLPTKYLTSQEVLEFRDKAFNSIYYNAGYLQIIERKFGEEAVKQIKEMMKWKPRNVTPSLVSSLS